MNKFEQYSRGVKGCIALLLVASAAGCGGGRDPILGADVAGLAPTVAPVVPLANAIGVSVNLKAITAAFSKAMDPATLTNTSFTLACPAATPVSGAVSYAATGNVATLTIPAATVLPSSTVCTATVTTAAKDTRGIPLASNFAWTFTTEDKTRPRVTVTVPVTAATAPTVANDTPITAVFSEAMAPATITAPGTFTVTCALPCVSPVAGTVSYAVGTRTAKFTPTAPSTLRADTTFTAIISTAATDLAGNQLAGNQAALPAASSYVWTFKTPADATVPTVTLVNPADGATLVCLDRKINATFSEDMAPATINSAPAGTLSTFTLKVTTVPGDISGTVAYDVQTRVATFTPTGPLSTGTEYTATITGAATDLAGNPLAASKIWAFTTSATPCAPVVPVSPVNFGSAAPFGIAATQGVTNTINAPITHINGNVVLTTIATCNAVAADNVGGFGLCGGFPPTINGTVVTPTFPDTTTANAVRTDLRAAYLAITPPAGPPAAGSLSGATPIAAGTTLGGLVGGVPVLGTNYFTPGVYRSITSILITGDLTLDAQGDPNATFIFQSSSTVGSADGAASPGIHTRILLAGGAKASNVFWQAGTSATLGTNTEWQGNILASANVTMKTGASSCGRLFAGAFTDGAFIFDKNVVSVPGNAFSPATCQ